MSGDGPVGAPHETFGAEGVVEALYLGGGVGVGVWLAGERPHVGDFDVDVGVACEVEQEFELAGMVERAVGHVIDDDVEGGILFDERDEVGKPGYGREDRHGDFEFGASSPERRHEGAANPIAFGCGCGAEAYSVKALLEGEAA